MSVNFCSSIPGEFFPLNHCAEQTCAHFGSLFIGSDIDGRQMRGKGTLLGAVLYASVLKLLLRAKMPAPVFFDLPISTAWLQELSTYLLWMSRNTLGEMGTCSMPL